MLQVENPSEPSQNESEHHQIFRHPGSNSYIFENVNCSIVNGIRRILLSELPHIAMDHETISNKNTIIEENTSCLHNEMLINRLSLIPLNNSHPVLTIKTYWDKETQTRKCEFLHPDLVPTVFLDVIHNEHISFMKTNMKVVTAENFVCLYPEGKNSLAKKADIDMNSELYAKRLFAKDPITKEHCLFLYLKPSPTEEKYQRLALSSTPIVGQPSTYASFCQVGTVLFENVMEGEKEQEKKFTEKINLLNKERLAKEMAPMNDVQIQKQKDIFKTLDSQRVYYKNKFGDARMIKLTVQSINDKSPNQLLYDAISWFLLKLHDLERCLSSMSYVSKHPKDLDAGEKCEWVQTDVQMLHACELNIRGESHTIGNLLSTFCKLLYVDIDDNDNSSLRDSIDFVSYNMPHPLHNVIRVRMKIKETKMENIFKQLSQGEEIPKHKTHQRNKTCSLLLSHCIDHVRTKYLEPMRQHIATTDSQISGTASFVQVEKVYGVMVDDESK